MPSDTSWFPKPRLKAPDKPASLTLLVCGVLLPVFAVAGIVVALSTSKSTPAPKAVAHTTTLDARDQARQAYSDCMKSMGAGGSARVGGRFGRFGGGSSDKFREANAVCGSLLRNGGRPGDVPTRTIPSSEAPVA